MFFLYIFLKIGEVVDGPDDNLRRPVFDGIEYDYGQNLMFFDNFNMVDHLSISFNFFFFFFGNKQRFSLVLCCYSVFDVDIGDGEPIRKLPYNRSGIFFLGPVFLWLIIIAVSVALHFPFHLLHTHTHPPPHLIGLEP